MCSSKYTEAEINFRLASWQLDDIAFCQPPRTTALRVQRTINRHKGGEDNRHKGERTTDLGVERTTDIRGGGQQT